LPLRWQTSGHYLIETLRAGADSGQDGREKFVLGQDVFIKQQSYALLNKIFFFIALVTAACIALWPVISVFLSNVAARQPVGAAVVQTTITGFGALTAYLYTYYKKRQTAAENLLRLIVFGKLPADRLAARVMDEMARIDQGVGFQGKHEADDDAASRGGGA